MRFFLKIFIRILFFLEFLKKNCACIFLRFYLRFGDEQFVLLLLLILNVYCTQLVVFLAIVITVWTIYHDELTI